MKITISNEFPPIYDRILAAFDLRGLQPIFAWGEVIYNPHGIDIPPALVTHERVHMVRQAGAPETWWQKYIESRQFRLNEELVAHAAEYQHMATDYSMSRNQRRAALHQVAQKLAHPLYRLGLSVKDAKAAIRGAV